MTVALSGKELAGKLEKKFPGSIVEATQEYLAVNGDSLLAVAAYCKDDSELKFDYINHITAVDYFEYFEVIYQLTSTQHNHTVVLKARCYDREHPVLPSVYGLWRGADFQEREIFDLMGINFEGHPNMKRIFLWEGFPGHPLRKDFL